MLHYVCSSWGPPSYHTTVSIVKPILKTGYCHELKYLNICLKNQNDSYLILYVLSIMSFIRQHCQTKKGLNIAIIEKITILTNQFQHNSHSNWGPPSCHTKVSIVKPMLVPVWALMAPAYCKFQHYMNWGSVWYVSVFMTTWKQCYKVD